MSQNISRKNNLRKMYENYKKSKKIQVMTCLMNDLSVFITIFLQHDSHSEGYFVYFDLFLVSYRYLICKCCLQCVNQFLFTSQYFTLKYILIKISMNLEACCFKVFHLSINWLQFVSVSCCHF
jgi:hypothetical protein